MSRYSVQCVVCYKVFVVEIEPNEIKRCVCCGALNVIFALLPNSVSLWYGSGREGQQEGRTGKEGGE